jgi:hypothetical protein
MLPESHPRHPSLSGTKGSPSLVETPNHSAAPKTSSPRAAGASASPKLAESPKKTTPPSPESHGLGTAGGVPLGGDLTWPQTEDSPQPISRVVETLAKAPDFIKVGFHIGRFIIATVNTQEE